MIARVSEVAAAEGLAFSYDHAQRASTVDAHRVLHLALVAGGPDLQGALKERLLESHFVRAENPADHAVLREVAVAAGLPERRVDEVLASDEYADEVDADQQQAVAYGASGVPFYVVDQKYGVSGAQPAEVFGQVLERAWNESHPAVQVLATGDACGPDGCAV
jgi:predicted DsbA family dithiol-disulfide isomerase